MKKQFIYQTGTINSLLEAVYEGDVSMEQLLNHGDFGLGALNDIDGELIIHNGICYRADPYGNLHILKHSNYTPFAVINKFEPSINFNVKGKNFQQLEEEISRHFPSRNLVYAIRVSGDFARVDLRSEHCTCRPYRRLTEILPALQTIYGCNGSTGTMIGVWFPAYLSQLNVPGFHFHFIDDECKTGGHVFGFELVEAKIELQVLHGLKLELIQNNDFYAAQLDIQNQAEVATVEQVRT